jgi:hypothetical protein
VNQKCRGGTVAGAVQAERDGKREERRERGEMMMSGRSRIS